MRILVVEDDDRVACGLVTALQHAGYEVQRVATAAAALQAGHADVVLLDLVLPDADGLDLLRRLRQTAGMAIIAVTPRAVRSASACSACAAVPTTTWSSPSARRAARQGRGGAAADPLRAGQRRDRGHRDHRGRQAQGEPLLAIGHCGR